MSVWPVPAAWPTAAQIRAGITLTAGFAVRQGGTGVWVRVEPIDWSISWSALYSPRVTVRVVMPYSSTVYAACAPVLAQPSLLRSLVGYGALATTAADMWASQGTAHTTGSGWCGDWTITGREWDVTAGQITVTATSAEQRLLDQPAALAPDTVAAPTTLAAVTGVMGGVVTVVTSHYAGAAGPALTIAEITDRLDAARTAADSISARIHGDVSLDTDGHTSDATVFVVAAPTGAEPSTAAISADAGGIITAIREDTTRGDGWASRVHLTHTWIAGTAVQTVRAAYPATAPAPRDRILTVERSGSTTQAAANAAAQAIWSRSSRRSRAWEIVTPPLIWCRPDNVITVTVAGETLAHVIDDVTLTPRHTTLHTREATS